jgi:hypothetical protein
MVQLTCIRLVIGRQKNLHGQYCPCKFFLDMLPPITERRHNKRDIERCCDSKERGLEPNLTTAKCVGLFKYILLEGSQDKCLVWPKCKLTLSVYWAKGRGATAKGRGRDHVNGSTSRKWSGRPLVGCMVLVDLLLVRSQGGALRVHGGRHNNYSKPKQEYNSD